MCNLKPVIGNTINHGLLLNRGGRGGGYKELDEEELEEIKRRRREAEEVRSISAITWSFLFYTGLTLFFSWSQDDGELYDEFGNLKKKFRAKTQQAEAGRALPGSGRAGWEVEELGICCISKHIKLPLRYIVWEDVFVVCYALQQAIWVAETKDWAPLA